MIADTDAHHRGQGAHDEKRGRRVTGFLKRSIFALLLTCGNGCATRQSVALSGQVRHREVVARLDLLHVRAYGYPQSFDFRTGGESASPGNAARRQVSKAQVVELFGKPKMVETSVATDKACLHLPEGMKAALGAGAKVEAWAYDGGTDPGPPFGSEWILYLVFQGDDLIYAVFDNLLS